MTPNEAAHLVERIVQTWPTGTRGRIWTETLEPLDAGRAGTAYVRLRGEAENPPSPARFLAVYRSLDTTRNEPPSHDYSNAISFDEYYARLLARVDRGDHDAATELAVWERNRGTGEALSAPRRHA